MAYMTHHLFLRISDLQSDINTLAQWQLYDAAGHCVNRVMEAVSLKDIAAALPPRAKCKVIVLLQAHNVLVTESKVSSHHVRHLRNVVAYAIEEQLAEAIEQSHVAMAKNAMSTHSGDMQTYLVCVVHNSWMQDLMRAFTTAEFTPSLVTSEALLLPSTTGTGTAIHEGNQVLFRLSPSAAAKFEEDTFLIFFENYLLQQKNALLDNEHSYPLHALHFLENEETLKEATPFLEKIKTICMQHTIAIDIQAFNGDTFDWLCQRWLADADNIDPINLLQKPYQLNSVSSLFVKQCKVVAVFAALWFVIQIGFNMKAADYLKHKADEFQAQSEAMYRELFPEDDRIVDLKAQMQQHLKTGEDHDDDFITPLVILTENTDFSRMFDIQSLSYDSDTHLLLLTVLAKDPKAFEQYTLPENARFSVEVASVIQDETGLHGEIKVQRK